MVLGSRNTVVHTQYVPEQEDHYSVDFDGTNDYVSIGDVGAIKAGSFWFKSDETINASGVTRRLMKWYDIGASNYFGITLGPATGVIDDETLTLMINNQTRLGTENYTFSNTEWYHVFFAWNSFTVTYSLFINGVAQTNAGSGDGSAQESINFTDFNLGRTDASNEFNGTITDVALWDAEINGLIAAPILYNGGVPHDPRIAVGNYSESYVSSLVNYWRMNDGGGTTVEDLVGSNDGTLENGAAWTNDSPYN
mgnify:CR=1 FL=1